MTPDWATGILIASAAQACLVVLALAVSRTPVTTNLRLAATVAVLAGMTTPYVFGWRGHREAADWLAFLPVNLPLAFGPLLYNYVRARLKPGPLQREWRHYLPAGLEVSYLAVCSMLPQPWLHGWKGSGHDHLVKPSIEIAVVASLATYSLMSLRLLHRTRTKLSRERSDADRFAVPLLWLVVIGLLVSTIALASVRTYAALVAEIDIGPYFLWLATISMALSLDAWRSSQDLPPPAGALQDCEAAQPSELPMTISELVRPTVSHDWQSLGSQWRNQIEAAGWWREPDLSVTALARRLGVNENYLSRSLNDGLGVNFNEMINAMRASEVARQLETRSDEDLLTIALDAGFSSKATFNRAFMKTFGTTPRDHRRRLKNRKLAVAGI